LGLICCGIFLYSIIVSDLFPARDFDHWAATYDAQVALADGFPFEGYAAVLDKILAEAEACPGMHVLDLGAGTGNLTAKFADLGCELWCVDFSLLMLLRTKAKLSGVRCLLADLRLPLPFSVSRRFDCVISAYTFHHFDLAQKVKLVCDLLRCFVVRGGRLVIGDIAFGDSTAQEHTRETVGERWEEEYYWIADEAIPALRFVGVEARYFPMSFCNGVFVIQESKG